MVQSYISRRSAMRKLANKQQHGKKYKGKYFYELQREEQSGQFILFGPLSTIRYISKAGQKKLGTNLKYTFAQVVKGRIVQAFTKDEILVTTKPIQGYTTPIDNELV